MSESEDRLKIFNALKGYADKYKADYYCVLLLPPGDFEVPVTLFSSKQIHTTAKGQVGGTIERLVEREILMAKPHGEE